MQIQIQQNGSVSVLCMPSRVLMADAPAIRFRIGQLVKEGCTRLVLDLKGVEMLDSSGLSTLVTALKTVGRHQGRVVLAAPTTDVQALLEITQLHHVFEIFEDVGAAVAELSDLGDVNAAA